MRPILTDQVALPVGLTVTVEPYKTAEPIEIPFGLRTGVGPRNYVLDGGQHTQWEGTSLRGKGGPL